MLEGLQEMTQTQERLHELHGGRLGSEHRELRLHLDDCSLIRTRTRLVLQATGAEDELGASIRASAWAWGELVVPW